MRRDPVEHRAEISDDASAWFVTERQAAPRRQLAGCRSVQHGAEVVLKDEHEQETLHVKIVVGMAENLERNLGRCSILQCLASYKALVPRTCVVHSQ